MDYILGVDGGGSKTLALLADVAGRVLGRGSAGTANYHVVGAARACAALEAAIAGAFAGAGIPAQQARGLALGLAGVDRPEDRAVFEGWAAESRLAERTLIANDAELVLAGGTPSGWGVALICGTGSIAYGRSPDGRTARAGGWGHLLGDEGSGYAIGLAGLQAVARAADGRGPATVLTAQILAQWGLAAPSDLIQRAYRAGPRAAEIAALAAVVAAAAEAGDAVASGIVDQAGRELALALAAVVRGLELPGPAPCAQAGGVILHSAQLAAAVRSAAAELGLWLDPVSPVPEPARGAVRLAQRLLQDPS